MKGIFEGLIVLYQKPDGTYIHADDQARFILDAARKVVKGGALGAAITYSANYGQTKTINSVYNSGGWQVPIAGANQGDVMDHMEQLLATTYSDLQGKMRIAPITTMSYSTPPFGKFTHLEVVDNDLANIKTLLDAGWTVFGWQNQDTGSSSYAVGGHIAKSRGTWPNSLSNHVQAVLHKYAKDYPKV